MTLEWVRRETRSESLNLMPGTGRSRRSGSLTLAARTGRPARIALLAAVGLLGLAVAWSGSLSSCRSDPLEVVDGPRLSEAVVVLRDCGSSGQSSIYVEVYPDGPRGGSEVAFEVDGGAGASPSWPDGRVPISATWVGDDRLVIRYRAGLRVRRQEFSVGRVLVGYEVSG